MEILDDNKTSPILIKNPESQNRTKYIDMTDAPSFTRPDKRRRTKNSMDI